MRVCIYGAGAIGCLIAARLSRTETSVSVIARGATLEVLQRQGIGVVEEEEIRRHPVHVAAGADELGVQDLIVIAVKQPALNEVIKQLGPLMGDHTRVLLAMNGVPWWFLDGLADAPSDPVLRCVDPEGDLRDHLPSRQLIGCVVHLSAVMESPGVVRLNGGNRLIIGEPGGEIGAVTRTVAELFEYAGFEVERSAVIQRDIWYKLWGNMTMNPVSALTRGTTDAILDDPLVNRFCCDVMLEAARVGSAIGLTVEQTPEQRNAGTRKLGAFKTSMLQDIEAGRSLEYEALIGTVYELARKVGKAVPNIEILYGLIRLLDRNAKTTRTE